ncbi:membrane protein insertion efficiency factor YidD [Catenovulum maritimum]|uniref:Alpha-hemolysin n=1 Tax=Catenovulum maritimum TaxID=1513271 RepID=A0A0J8GMC3_9ALTE|nr:membrane protein insertion efficiency factor YidD [Catenovulum maritimum]KMT63982.1 alpha-hemolysin [Catenovulum maritimum]
MVKRAILAAIRRYQVNGGSKHYFGLACNFSPTCSEYTAQAIEKYGVLSGVKLGIKRICRCNQSDCPSTSYDPLN